MKQKELWSQGWRARNTFFLGRTRGRCGVPPTWALLTSRHTSQGTVSVFCLQTLFMGPSLKFGQWEGVGPSCFFSLYFLPLLFHCLSGMG